MKHSPLPGFYFPSSKDCFNLTFFMSVYRKQRPFPVTLVGITEILVLQGGLAARWRVGQSVC